MTFQPLPIFYPGLITEIGLYTVHYLEPVSDRSCDMETTLRISPPKVPSTPPQLATEGSIER